MFWPVRRASTCGPLKRPPSAGMLMPWPLLIVAMPIVSVAPVPTRPEASPVICGTSVSATLPRKLIVRVPVPVTATSSRFESASRADSIARLSSGNGDRRRRLAVERERERAAGRVGDGERLALVRELAVERAEAAGVAPAGRRVVTRDHPQVVVGVEVDVAGDVAAGAAVVVHAEDLLLAGEIEVGRRRRRRLDELEARELEVADVRIPGAQRRGEVRSVLLVLRRRRVVQRRRDRVQRAVG